MRLLPRFGPIVDVLGSRLSRSVTGTGGRETEMFVRGLGSTEIGIYRMVNESGASSTRPRRSARQEFRISMYRAWLLLHRAKSEDPFGELVKIDPIDGLVNTTRCRSACIEAIARLTSSCVASIALGRLNTASPQTWLILGLCALGKHRGAQEQRTVFGATTATEGSSRTKSISTAAVFLLRIRDATHPLDASAGTSGSVTILSIGWRGSRFVRSRSDVHDLYVKASDSISTSDANRASYSDPTS